jgi:hypothetical protein
MKELNEIVINKTSEMINDGTVESLITERLEKTIAESIDSAMKSYGEFGKAITQKIKSSIQCAGQDIILPEYNQFIKKVVEDKFAQVLEKNAVPHLTELIEDVIKPVKKEAKISELLNKIEELWGDIAREEGNDCINIETEENDDGTALYVSLQNPEWDDETIKVTFYSFKRDEGLWHIGYINDDGTRITGKPINKAKTHTNGVTDMIYKYYAMGTKFEMDTEIEDIYVGH